MANPNTADGSQGGVGVAPTGAPGSPMTPTGADDPEVLAANKIITDAQTGVTTAQTEYDKAAAAFSQLLSNPNAMFDTTGAVKAASDRVDTAQRALISAQNNFIDAQTKLATASQAAAARVAASRNQTPGLGDYYTQNAAKAAAEADLAKAQVAALNAKSPADIASVQAQTADATAHAASLGILTPAQANAANAQAAQASAQASQISTLTPLVAAKTAADTANTQAQTQQLVPAQAKSALSAAGLNDAQAAEVIGKTPAEIDNLVATGALTQAQADLVKAQIPGTQATTAKTEAETQQLKLGGLFGIQDRINAMRDAIARGEVTPDQANDQLNQYIQSQISEATTGASSFDRTKAALEAETTRRGQDSTLAGTEASSFGSFAGNSLGTLADLNKYAPPGSGALAGAYGSLVGNMYRAFQGFQPNTPVDSPLVKSLAPQPAAPAPDTGTSGHQITINIGGTGGAPAVSTQPSTSADPSVAGSPAAAPAPFAQSGMAEGSSQGQGQTPAFLANQAPATPSDVAAVWANDPHLNGAAMQRGAE